MKIRSIFMMCIVTIMIGIIGISNVFAMERIDISPEKTGNNIWVISEAKETQKDYMFRVKPAKTGLVSFIVRDSGYITLYDSKMKQISHKEFNDSIDSDNYYYAGLKGDTPYYAKVKMYLGEDYDADWSEGVLHKGSFYYESEKSKVLGGKTRKKAKVLKKNKMIDSCMLVGKQKTRYYKFTTNKKKITIVGGVLSNGKIGVQVYKNKKSVLKKSFTTSDGLKTIKIKNKKKVKRTYYIKVYPKTKYASGVYVFKWL